jgi:hypothetical protein
VRSDAADTAARIADSGAASPAGTPRVYTLRAPAAPAALLAALRRTVEDWGGEWTPQEPAARLRLPVHAGLRRGVLDATASAAPAAGGGELRVEVLAAHFQLDRAAVLLLVTAALAAVTVVLWPFFPALARLAPVGLVLGASVWLVVLARLRHEGPRELLAEVDAALQAGEPGTTPPPMAPG